MSLAYHGNRRANSARRKRLGAESPLVQKLERRRLLAFTVTQTSPGFFQVDGDAAADNISISVNQDVATFSLGGQTYSSVQHITVNGNGGDDTINIASNGANTAVVGAAVFGGDGDDSITMNIDGAAWGGAGNDTIRMTDS